MGAGRQQSCWSLRTMDACVSRPQGAADTTWERGRIVRGNLRARNASVWKLFPEFVDGDIPVAGSQLQGDRWIVADVALHFEFSAADTASALAIVGGKVADYGAVGRIRFETKLRVARQSDIEPGVGRFERVRPVREGSF